MNAKHNSFDASTTMAGYLYQSRLALLYAMRRARVRPSDYVVIEKFDDISFHDSDSLGSCLLQAKHSVQPGNLTDTSQDVWRTLRIWCEQTHQDPCFPINCELFLITTATAAPGSAMEKLRPGTSNKDRAEAVNALQRVAEFSTYKATKNARQSFVELPANSKTALVHAITVLDAAPDIVDIRDSIEAELVFTTTDHQHIVAEQLEGWWLDRVAASLIESKTSFLAVQDIIKKVVENASRIQRNELPITIPENSSEHNYAQSDEQYIFVQQMRAVNLQDNVVKRGVNDFYKAKAQRSRWAREELLLDGETEKYDQKLKDRWEREFDQLVHRMQIDTEKDKIDFGQQLFFWAQNQETPFRNVVEAWITAGSYHNLANYVQLGWHPNYAMLFSKLSEGTK